MIADNLTTKLLIAITVEIFEAFFFFFLSLCTIVTFFMCFTHYIQEMIRIIWKFEILKRNYRNKQRRKNVTPLLPSVTLISL